MASKYKATRTVVNGIMFDSKAEAFYYLFLKNEERRGKIEIVELQPKVYLTEAKILYKPDFLIRENTSLVYIDVKGFSTSVFAIKARLWAKYGKGLLRIVKDSKIIKEIQTT